MAKWPPITSEKSVSTTFLQRTSAIALFPNHSPLWPLSFLKAGSDGSPPKSTYSRHFSSSFQLLPSISPSPEIMISHRSAP